MRKLWLDFETRSFVDLKGCGLDVYVHDPTTEVLMLGWAFDDEEVALWIPVLGEPMPERLRQGLLDDSVQKMAWNYNFEKDHLEHKLKIVIRQELWGDPSVQCAYMSLPAKLERAAKALNVGIELEKTVVTGKGKPVKMFSEPTKQKKTVLKKNPTAPQWYFKDWTTHPEKWQEFCDYCKQDVRAERAVWHALQKLNCPMPESEKQAWLLDQRMNERGVWIDKQFVANAKAMALSEVTSTIEKMTAITHLEKTLAPGQLGDWLRERGYPYESMDKEHVEEALKVFKSKMTAEAYGVLEMKQKLGGSAYTKLQTIEDRVGVDGRLRDQFVYHGAHTGRWAGRGVQLQNLFKPDKAVSKFLDSYVRGIRLGKKIVTRIPQMTVVASTIRASFAATPGMKLNVGDLAQIESRVLAALAGCETMIHAYANGLDLYKDIMSFLLEKPYSEITSGERANGKVIILGCGFGMGWEKFIEYAATFGVTLDEKTAKKYVYAFREKYSEIPEYWKALEQACIKAVKLNVCVYVKGVVVDGRNPEMLKIKLPSGRHLHYFHPEISEETTDWGTVREGVIYESWDAKGRQIKRLYGGLICENVVQAVARDILLHGMLTAEEMGFVIIMTIHDEIVGESPIDGPLGHKELLQALTKTPQWAEGMGFVLAAEGYECPYYKK